MQMLLLTTNLGKQGKEKPLSVAAFRDCLMVQDEPILLYRMADGQPFVQPIYSILKYAAAGRNQYPQHEEEYTGTIGDRESDTDPPFVVLKWSYFDWRNVKPVKDTDDTNNIARWFGSQSNRTSFFNANGKATEDAAVVVSKLPLIPAEVALRITTQRTTPWELYEKLCNFGEVTDQAVIDHLRPAKLWAIMAATKSSTARSSTMAYQFSPVTLPSKHLRNFMGARLNATFGIRTQKEPTGAPPLFAQ